MGEVFEQNIGIDARKVQELGMFVHRIGMDGREGYATMMITALLSAAMLGLSEEDCVQNTRTMYRDVVRLIGEGKVKMGRMTDDGEVVPWACDG